MKKLILSIFIRFFEKYHKKIVAQQLDHINSNAMEAQEKVTKDMIAYFQEVMEQGYPIYLVLSPELADSEFGIIVNTTNEPLTFSDIQTYLNEAPQGGKYEQ